MLFSSRDWRLPCLQAPLARKIFEKMVIAVTAQLFCAAQRLPCLQAPLDNGTREERGGAGRRAGGCLSTKSSRPEKKKNKKIRGFDSR